MNFTAAKTALAVKLGKSPKAMLQDVHVAHFYYNMTVRDLEAYIAQEPEPVEEVEEETPEVTLPEPEIGPEEEVPKEQTAPFSSYTAPKPEPPKRKKPGRPRKYGK
jgi:hypothetical protein